MGRHDISLMVQIEREALDEQAPLAGALRKCVVLGGRSGSERLRDWAVRELEGYRTDHALPAYRTVPAQLQIDGTTMNALVTGQPIARSSLPDFVQKDVGEEVHMRDGIGAIEALVAQAETTGEPVRLSLPMGGDVARLMSAELHGQRVLSVYWALPAAALRGVLDQVRTALTVLVAELHANTSNADALPSAEVADRAVQVVVTGRRPTVTVNTTQVHGDGASGAVVTGDARERESPFWTRSRYVGAAVVGAATIVGAVSAAIALLR